jgi:NADH-quinone oxidoreductase subunit L
MVFLGSPRTPAADHASEHDPVFAWMTVPLIVLGFFAVAAGWVAIPRSFPVLGLLSSNPFSHYLSGLAQALEIEAAELPFSITPLMTSLIVALGGLALGWAVYRGYTLARPDPLAPVLGRLYVWMQNKYYFDELYDRVFVKGTKRLSGWLFRFDDLWVIDPIVDGVGRLGRQLSERGRWIDIHIVDAAVNGVAAVTDAVGGAVRVIQTGKVQNYLLVGLITISVLLGAFLLMPK